MKFVQCRKCFGKNVGKSGREIAPKGWIVLENTAQDGVSTDQVLKECDCHKTWRLHEELVGKAKRANLSPKWENYDIDKDYVGTESKSYVDRLKTYVSRRVNPNETSEVKTALDSSVLYFYGPNGTQKTTLANWAGYQFLKNGRSVYYCTMNDLCNILADPEKEDVVKRLLTVDMLIIDESFDNEKVLVYNNFKQVIFLDNFFRNRIQVGNRGIIFISNIEMENITNVTYTDRYGQNFKNSFLNCKSLQDLVVRNVKLCNGYFKFLDNYVVNIDEKSINDALSGGLF